MIIFKMMFIKNYKRYILATLYIVTILYFISRKSLLFTLYIEYHNIFQSSHNNINLVKLIKSHVLIPPAPVAKQLNLETKIWTSPVAEIVQKILKNKTGGFFIECGAYDGEWLSNSLELETYFGWEGLLIEADPTYGANLFKKNRKAWIAPVCLSPEPYAMKVTMQRHKEWPAMSNNPNFFYGKREKGDFPIQFQVQCFPLYSILLASNKTEIDYFSLDVEGAEWSIIRNIPLDILRIKVISLEVSKDYPLTAMYLQDYGYEFYATVRKPFVFDHIYVHNSINIGLIK